MTPSPRSFHHSQWFSVIGGERLYGARNFLDLYGVFTTPRVLRVVHGTLIVSRAHAQPRQVGRAEILIREIGCQGHQVRGIFPFERPTRCQPVYSFSNRRRAPSKATSALDQ